MAGGRASFVMSSALRDLAHAIARARRASVCASPRASRGYAKAARRCTNRRERCCQALAHLCANCHSMGLSAAGARHPPARTAYSRSVVKQITWPGGQMPCFTAFHAAGSKQVVARLCHRRYGAAAVLCGRASVAASCCKRLGWPTAGALRPGSGRGGQQRRLARAPSPRSKTQRPGPHFSEWHRGPFISKITPAYIVHRCDRPASIRGAGESPVPGIPLDEVS